MEIDTRHRNKPFSKFAAAYPALDKKEAAASTLFSRCMAEGCRWPKTALSDRGAEFENKVMFTRITRIAHVITKGYNPRENDIT